MTQYPELKATINGREVCWEEISHWKAMRSAHVLQELVDFGQTLYLNGQPLPNNQFYSLSEDELLQASIESKLALGQDKILELYADKLAESDQMWTDIVANTPKGAPLKEAHVIFEIKGISPALIANIDKEGGMDVQASYAIHPEHYVFSQKGNVQHVMETFGGYKNPSYFRLEMLDPKTNQLPGKVDPRAVNIIFGVGHLVSKELNIQQYAMHQFIPTETGLKVDLGIFAPAGVPDEAIVGHMEHFAVEFGSIFKMAIDAGRQAAG
ncbi:hypothetical protein [Streptococcus loxodontisalivarius]|uniref:Uncharacterized protein n=1 Tax=Streptococcus loxodontisalivarius TaxID=1349415 RepID=A0ABS2PRR9_9STRE|nr:hypothetical protein [Streptococcus loxodontisalivarius]MBM7642255.1 hypothetical protein [Streptococcus loxodontisalivarius]